MAEYKVGNSVLVRLNDGRLVEAKSRAIIEETNGLRLQIDFEPNQTARAHEKQVSKD